MLRTAAFMLDKVTKGGAAVSCVAVAQAVVHTQTYRPLPPLDALERGRELPTLARERVEARLRDHAAKLRAVDERVKAKREVLERELRARRDALERRLTERREDLASRVLTRIEDVRGDWEEKKAALAETWAARADALSETWAARRAALAARLEGLSRGREAPDGPLATAAGPGAPRATPGRRVLFLGDSLVTGVGGSQSLAGSQGPPLARRVSRLVADALGLEVEWRALGSTGGDVRVLREALAPRIDGRYDVVVIMCGLNDFKMLASGELRTPWAFRRDLENLIDDVRAKAGPNCRVVLPAYPVGLAGIEEPLKSVVGLVAGAWDGQKRRLAARSGTTFVDVFERPDRATYTAADNVHPNEAGYELWARHIAGALVRADSGVAVG